VADAERYKREVEAAGQANAITIVFSAIRNANPDSNLIAIQYLDSLKAIANGRASKVFIPYEASGVLGALGGIQELFKEKPNGTPTIEVPVNPSQPPTNLT
jgi:regulator of protease activity HflC (stomatin/prohibitin superfamily)